MQGLDLQQIIRDTIAEYRAGENAAADATAAERDALQRLLVAERALTMQLKQRLAELARLASQTERGL